MTYSLRSTRVSLTILATALLCAVGAAMLPDDRYQRFQLLDQTIHRKSHWIYERVHFDPTPVDVMLIGSSRMDAAVSPPRLERYLQERGLPSHVVSFALPEEGRDVHYALLEELYKTKAPKLVIIGVRENPARVGHSTFKYLADRSLIVDPAFVSNANYPSNLIYLPYRQMKLFAAQFAPDMFGLTTTYDSKTYRGSNIETSGDIHMPDGTIKEGDIAAPLPELERGVKKLEAGVTPRVLPASMEEIEFGAERVWVRKMAALAERHGTKVAFLFLPYYTGTDKVDERRFYDQVGPLWSASFTASHAEWYSDYAHLTGTGAQHVTDWLGPKVAAELSEPKR